MPRPVLASPAALMLPNMSQTPKSILVVENRNLEMAMTGRPFDLPSRSCKDRCALIVCEFKQNEVSGALEAAFATRFS